MPATPFSYRQYPGDGATVDFSVPFPYLLKAHVKVYIGFDILDGTFTSELADGVGFSWTSGTQIQVASAPASGQTLTVIRQTPNSTRLVDWQDGSNLISDDLDTADLQNLYVVQEQQDRNDAVVSSATQAISIANDALASVSNTVQYAVVADVAAIPGSPANNTYIEVADSTGIQSFTPLSGLPAGFVGAAALTVRLRYSTAGNSWNWLNYFANDSEARYLAKAGGTMTGAITFAAGQPTASTSSPGIVQLTDSVASTSTSTAATPSSVKTAYDLAAAAASKAYVDTADAALLPKAGGTMTGAITFAAGQSYPQVPQNAKTAAYTLVASDAGKHISITTGGVTIPQNVFSVGDAISIYNNSGSSQTITQGTGVTLRLAGTSLSGNRTIALYGLCTILCVASNDFVINGAGLS